MRADRVGSGRAFDQFVGQALMIVLPMIMRARPSGGTLRAAMTRPLRARSCKYVVRGTFNIYEKRADGTGDATLLLDAVSAGLTRSWKQPTRRAHREQLSADHRIADHRGRELDGGNQEVDVEIGVFRAAPSTAIEALR